MTSKWVKASDNLSPQTTEKTKSVTFRDTTECASIEFRKFDEKSKKKKNKQTNQTKNKTKQKKNIWVENITHMIFI